MSYINIQTLEKVEAVDIMLAFPNVSFPNRGWTDDDLAPFGYAELNWPEHHPQPGTYEKLIETTPVKIDNKWYIQLEVVPMSQNEINAKNAHLSQNIMDHTYNRLDTFASTRGYDNIVSLCTYATSSNQQYKIEGEYGVTARDQTWKKIFDILNQVEAGERPMPTDFNLIVNELPELKWPS